jgi:hypothetical protein
MPPRANFKEIVSKIAEDLAAARAARRGVSNAESDAKASPPKGQTRLKFEVKDTKATRGVLAAVMLVVLAFLVSLVLA